MLLRKTTWFWKSGLAAISFVLILSISGCSDAPPEENTVSETVIDVQAIQEESEEDADEIISVCIDLYEKAEEENKLADLETIRSIVNRLGENGYSAVDSRNQINMTEPEKVVEFCEKVDAQEEAEITILEISYLGGFVKYDLHTKGGNVDVVRSYYKYENGNMKREVIGNYQAEYWNYTEEGSVSNVAEIKLTEKGYFIYAYEYVIAHASLRQYWRIEPLSEECRKLTQEYISGLSYVNYNVLVTNWNSSNVKDILMPCMYEDIYRISTGENLKTEDWKIPAEEYERIMTTYFPVSIEQLREYCGYDEGSNSYEYEMIYASPYPPFGEVVDYTKNADGTITLIVDGVWPDYNSDLAFRNTVVVQPFEDGTFRYLSNSIEQIELELPPIARTKG